MKIDFNLIEDSDKLLIKQVVDVLEMLKGMDKDRLQDIANQVLLAKPLFPKELFPGIEALAMDFALVISFIEMTRRYDKTAQAIDTANIILKQEAQNEGRE